jgi:hypothetical protein
MRLKLPISISVLSGAFCMCMSGFVMSVSIETYMRLDKEQDESRYANKQ